MYLVNYRIHKVIRLLIILNLTDFSLTWYGLSLGLEQNIVKELNTLMWYFYKVSPLVFAFVKLVIGTLGFLFLNYLVEVKKTGKLTCVILPAIFIAVNINNIIVIWQVLISILT